MKLESMTNSASDLFKSGFNVQPHRQYWII